MLQKIKKLLPPFITLVMIAACSVQKPVKTVTTPEITTEDSTEYELIVFDPGFETWYLLKKSPATDHSIEYYKTWNIQYVHEWNHRSGTSRYLGPPIDYNTNENYPFEIEHKLYYYFLYVENELDIPILQGKVRVMHNRH